MPDKFELLNSGKGKKSPNLQLELFEDVKKRKLNRDIKTTTSLLLDNSEMLQQIRTTDETNSPQTAAKSPVIESEDPSLSFSLYSLKYGCDKWPNCVEDAFMKALRIVMKNGTSKIKLKDRNYGRNELISLYIRFCTNEHRTKKQISSHIQVWKKAILSKVSNNIQLTVTDKELLTLIEEGAKQTEETTRLFYKVFENVIDLLEPSDADYDNQPESNIPQQIPLITNTNTTNIISNNGMPLTASSNSNIFYNYPVNNPSSLNYPSLITPKSSQITNPDNIQNYQTLDHHPLQYSNAASSYPITPLDYAKSIYENLKTYKCVPVKLEDENYSVFLKDAPSNPNSVHFQESIKSSNSIPTIANSKNNSNNSNADYTDYVSNAARKVESEQRRLIEQLNRKVESSNITERSMNIASFYDRHQYSQDDQFNKQEWQTSQDQQFSMHLPPKSQPPQQRFTSGNSMVSQQDVASNFIHQQTQPKYQGQLLIQQTQPPLQYLPQMPYQQQQLTQSQSQKQQLQQQPMYFYQPHAYIPSTTNYSNSQYRSNVDIPFEQFSNNNQDDES